MNYTISEEVVARSDLNMDELLVILLIKTGTDIPKLFNSMEEKQMIVKDSLFGGYLVTQRWDDTVSSVLLDSDKERQSPDRLDSLTTKLMDIFPRQKKEGTCHYFRGNKKDISLRLKKFFKLYGNTYTDEQILNAAKQYVESFNGNYSYMRILKYFIWKDERKTDSEGKVYIEETSDLANYIENEGAGKFNSNWTAELK